MVGKKFGLVAMFSFFFLIFFAMSVSATDVPQNASNANGTGETTSHSTLNKNLTGNPTWAKQRIHGDFQNNTNACSSCHKTHTGEAANLLFTSTASAACDACHDGTVANSLHNGISNAGVFEGESNELGMSEHSIDVKNETAPGLGTAISGNLECSSCHNVHGSDNYAMLRENISGTAGRGIATKIKDTAPTTGADSDSHVLVWTTVDTTKAPWNKGYYKSLVDTGFPDGQGGFIQVQNGQKVLMTYELANNRYQIAYPMWKIGSENTSAAFKMKPVPESVDGVGAFIDYKHGIGYGNILQRDLPVGTTDLSLEISISVQPSVIETEVDGLPIKVVNNRSYYDANYENYNAGAGRQLSLFCSQCHTDYMSYSRGNKAPTLNAHGHNTSSDRYSCTRCHFAHGTSKEIMRDAAGNRIVSPFAGDKQLVGQVTNPATGQMYTQQEAEDYMVDTNDSSANKRYTGASVCFSCHATSHKVPTEDQGSLQSIADQGKYHAGDNKDMPNNIPF